MSSLVKCPQIFGLFFSFVNCVACLLLLSLESSSQILPKSFVTLCFVNLFLESFHFLSCDSGEPGRDLAEKLAPVKPHRGGTLAASFLSARD
jgi:hypothetical protein